MTEKITFSYSAKEVYSCDYPTQELTITIPTTDLNVHQLYTTFRNFLRGIGFSEENVLAGALKMATNVDNYTEEVINEALEKQGLMFVENCRQSEELISFAESMQGTYLEEDRIDNFPSL